MSGVCLVLATGTAWRCEVAVGGGLLAVGAGDSAWREMRACCWGASGIGLTFRVNGVGVTDRSDLFYFPYIFYFHALLRYGTLIMVRVH
jgi:hypothetical protein